MTMRSVNECPEARIDSLLTEQVGDELVIFDGLTNEAHALKPLAAVIFGASDGSRSIAELAAVASAKLGQPVETEQVETALVELEDCGLLVDSTPDGMSRRRLLQVGGAAAAGVLVSSALVPALAAASTTCSIAGLSQFGILIYDGSHYYFITGGLANAGNGATITGACGNSLGGNSNGNGSDGSCWHNLSSLPGPDGVQHTLTCPYSSTITFKVSGSDLIYTLPPGTTLVAWWAHNGTVCAGPFGPSTSTTLNNCTYTTNPCTAF